MAGTPQNVILHLWEERPRFQKFWLPVNMVENIKSWVHEFSELSIWNILRSFGLRVNILNSGGFKIILPDGEKQIHKPAHVLVALHTISTIRSTNTGEEVECSPSEYFEILIKAHIEKG